MYQLQHYLDMMIDRHRMVPLEAAIRSMVKLGHTVLDLGAGTGVLTFLALKAGAAHVYAIERSPLIEIARRIARANGIDHRITFIHADARTVTPPQRVDGLIGDVRGVLPLLGDNIDLFETVRGRWLKPGGYTIPLADEIIVAPVSATKPRAPIDGWNQKRPEADYECAAEIASNGVHRVTFEPGDVLAEGRPLGAVRYDGTNPRKLALKTSFVMPQSRTLTGLGLWFRGTLAPDIPFDTSPSSPSSVYGQAFFPLSSVRPVKAGESIAVEVTAHRTPSESVWGWKVSSSRSPGWQESHSTLKSVLLMTATLEWLTGTTCPGLSEEGRITRHVLANADGHATARELAAGLVSAFPERFGSVDDALPAVMKVLERYASS
jgi:SAM-dependent methyltransferase